MLAVMYHYVRPREKHLKYSHFLEMDEFRSQLDTLQAEQGAVSQEDFLRIVDGRMEIPEKGFLLTFDDGLKDHYRYVLPELVHRGLWGMFFVPSGQYRSQRMLNVHGLHYLLGNFGGEQVHRHLEGILTAQDIVQEYLERYKENMYVLKGQDDDEIKVKRLINYFVRKDRQDEIMDRLADSLGQSLGMVQEYYLTAEEIAEMDRCGMLMGGHGKTHAILSQLSPEQQEQEIVDSYEFLSDIVGQGRPRTFCYPHGQPYTFTEETKGILRKHGCRLSFAVGNRPVEQDDIASGSLALPRYNCAQLELIHQ
ncbi:MAG: polysaccharide deacetylase family protein [Proteobacteria bacterium]|nr:polysaccharide deacetylase family protein [Pseudomonadota bacterium]MBU4384642.1 polysaccharide deacetylase family protein [Pseudomonadota bacterium]MCG2766210.1 polysaccharide deacetylase family protein [Desulfarculaceae bacterium]